MKKIVFMFITVLMLAVSSVCMAADGGDLNKEQKNVELFISGITTENLTYDKFSAGFDASLKSKLDSNAYDTLKNEVKTKFGDLKEVKFYSFERYDAQDKVTYISSFSQEEIVAMVFIFNKDGKLAEFGLMPMQKQEMPAEQTAQ